MGLRIELIQCKLMFFFDVLGIVVEFFFLRRLTFIVTSFIIRLLLSVNTIVMVILIILVIIAYLLVVFVILVGWKAFHSLNVVRLAKLMVLLVDAAVQLLMVWFTKLLLVRFSLVTREAVHWLVGIEATRGSTLLVVLIHIFSPFIIFIVITDHHLVTVNFILLFLIVVNDRHSGANWVLLGGLRWIWYLMLELIFILRLVILLCGDRSLLLLARE